jgi:hypothetical protein
MDDLMREPITVAIIRRVQRALITHPGATTAQLKRLTGYAAFVDHLLDHQQMTRLLLSITVEGQKRWYLKRAPTPPLKPLTQWPNCCHERI